jgi:hypothetical protein
LAVCSIDNPADVRPFCHTFVETMLPWLRADDGLPRYAEAEVGAVWERWKAEQA